MLVTLTASEMLELRRQCRGFEPPRTDCIVRRTDAIDLDRLLSVQTRAWYLQLLRTSDPALLPVTDLASSARLIAAPDSVGIILLPERFVRLVEVKLGGWERPARIVSAADAEIVALQSSPYTRGGCVDPVAVVEPGRLRLYSRPDYDAHPAVESLLAVIEPPDGLYILDESLLP